MKPVDPCPECGEPRRRAEDDCRICGWDPYVAGVLNDPPKAPVLGLLLVALCFFSIIALVLWFLFWVVPRIG